MNNSKIWLPFLEWDSLNKGRSGGISLNMINDKERNVFYKNIISEECKGRVCVDIGAGNGLLTFLAIKHGAKHVYCIEADVYTCSLLKEIAIELEFFDKITIINESFKISNFDSYNWSYGKPEIIIHEIVSSQIFNDFPGNITDAFNTKLPDDITIVPGKYGCNIFSTIVNKKIFDNLTSQSKEYSQAHNHQVDFVETGVSTDFDTALQKHRTNFLNLPYKQLHIGNNKLKILKKNLEFVDKIDFDLNKTKKFPECFSLNLKSTGQYRVVFLHFNIGHKNSYLNFNFDTNTSFGNGVFYAVDPNISILNISTNKGTIWFE